MLGATRLPVRRVMSELNKWHFLRDLSFQLSLACLLVSAIFSLFSPEAATLQSHVRYVLWSCLGCAVPVVYWVTISGVPGIVKPVMILFIAFFAWAAGQRSVSEFDRSYQVLNPPEFQNGRFIHQALGLSYAKLPHFEENLVPRFFPSGTRPEESTRNRLRKGERVLLNQMTLVRASPLRESAPTMIHFEIANFHPVSRETFVRDIRNHEANWRSRPTTRITRPTQGCWIAGRDMLEFEVLVTSLNVTSRFVHLHDGDFLLTFVFTTTREEDRPLFDEFLKSIRFDSAE
jgi:hypothetical protein